MQVSEANVGYLLLILIATIIVVCWLTIDKEDFQKRFDKAHGEDSE